MFVFRPQIQFSGLPAGNYFSPLRSQNHSGSYFYRETQNVRDINFFTICYLKNKLDRALLMDSIKFNQH